MLEDTDPAPHQLNLLDTMDRSGHRLRALIESLLEFDGIEAGEVDNVPAAVDPGAVVPEVVTAAAAETRRLTLRSDVDPGLPALVVVDSDRLRQVLGNVVDNAIKFTQTGGVTLTASVRFVHRTGPARLRLLRADSDVQGCRQHRGVGSS